MMSTFYRVHWADCPPLTAANAWSGLWGSIRSADGSRTRCTACDGTGEGWRDCPRCKGDGTENDGFTPCPRCKGDGILPGCNDCGAEGWTDCVRGYSCTHTPQELVDYFCDPARSGTADSETVIVFEGQQADTGFDGEPTAIPDRIVESLSWARFVASVLGS